MNTVNDPQVYLAKNGMPTRKTPGFNHTPLSKVIPEEFIPSNDTPSLDYKEFSHLTDHIFYVSRDGIQCEAPLPQGITLYNDQGEEVEIRNSFQALAMQQKISKINFDEKFNGELIALVYDHDFSEGNNDHTNFAMEIGQGANVSVVEIKRGKSKNLALYNHFTNIKVHENANLKLYSGFFSQDSTQLINNQNVYLEKGSNFKQVCYFGQKNYARTDYFVQLNGELANAQLFGLYALKDEQTADLHLNIQHSAPHSESSQLFKGLLKEKSKAIFTGKVLVDHGANLVNSSQINKNILLDSSAQVQTEPQLEVYTDDVKCGHGATVGQLSEEELFYLESRGLPKQKAYQVLSQAFVEEVLQQIEHQSVRKLFSDHLFSHYDFSSFGNNF